MTAKPVRERIADARQELLDAIAADAMRHDVQWWDDQASEWRSYSWRILHLEEFTE